MTSPRLQLIAAKLDRQSKAQERAPAPEGHGLGEAIEAAVEQTVDRRIEQALAEQRQQLMRQPPMPTQLPPIKKPIPVVTSAVTRRDRAGRILRVETQVTGAELKLITEVLGRDPNGSMTSWRTYPDTPAQ